MLNLLLHQVRPLPVCLSVVVPGGSTGGWWRREQLSDQGNTLVLKALCHVFLSILLVPEAGDGLECPVFGVAESSEDILASGLFQEGVPALGLVLSDLM